MYMHRIPGLGTILERGQIASYIANFHEHFTVIIHENKILEILIH